MGVASTDLDALSAAISESKFASEVTFSQILFAFQNQKLAFQQLM